MIIFKYKIDNDGISLPAGAQILSCQLQDNCFHIWALVDPNESNVEHYNVQVVGTGHEFDPTGWDYLTTEQQPPFVWHIWVKKINIRDEWEFS